MITVITINKDTGERVYSRKEVADICHVSPQTIRLWEDAGLIPHSERTENDYRYWAEDALKVIQKYAELPLRERRKED